MRDIRHMTQPCQIVIFIISARYQIGNMRDVCQTLVSQHSEPKLDYAPQPHKSKTEEDQQLVREISPEIKYFYLLIMDIIE